MIDLLKELINKNEDVKATLQDCSDEFLLANQSIIFAALDEENTPEGYKVSIIIKDDVLEWGYAPTNEETKEFEMVSLISSMYRYKLPVDWHPLYKANLNDITWTEDKRPLVAPFKRVISEVEDGKKQVKGFWLTASSGRGKTFATIALLNKVATLGKTVSYVDISELSTTMKKTFGSFEDSSVAYIQKISKSDVVVISGLETKKPTDWVKSEILLPILSFRSKADKTTIFSSTLSIDKFTKRLASKDTGLYDEPGKKPNDVDSTLENSIISEIKFLIKEEIEI